MTEMPEEKTGLKSQTENIVLAVLLYLFGEKSLVLAALALHGFDHVFKGKTPSTEYVYEASLYGLLIGTCLVIVISKVRQKQLEKDNLAIFIGMVTATLAALLNIADVYINEPEKYGPIPPRALFFFVLWTLLVVFPAFVRVLQNGKTGEIDLTNLVRTASALLVAAVVGFVLRPIISAIVFFALEPPGAGSFNGAFDWMRFNSDSLIMLGAVWWVAGFCSFSGKQMGAWRMLYVLAAPIAAFTYAYFISFPAGDPTYQISALHLGIGFGGLALAAILPGLWFAEGSLAGDGRALFLGAVWTFCLCAVAMFLGLSFTLPPLTLAGQILISCLQGVAGACIPLSVFVSGWLLRRF